MMNIIYISPSSIPSNSANSLHVLNQSLSLNKVSKKKIILFFSRTSFNSKYLINYLKKNFNLNNNLDLKNFYYPFSKYNNFLIFIYFCLHFFLYFRKYKNSFIISRNIYASFFLSYFPIKKHMYESHMVEMNFLTRWIQKKIISNKNIITLFITKNLKNDILKYYQINNNNRFFVLSDAANNFYFSKSKINILTSKLTKSDSLKIGYFGQLLEGRGIDIVIKIACHFKNINFFIFGGNSNQINNISNKYDLSDNIYFMGHVEYIDSLYYMKIMDILLLPYQNNVSINTNLYSTSRWMSPMKLFEYMHAKKPIISSDLTVLKEVLSNNENSILVKPNSISGWVKAINKLINDKDFSKKISNCSYRDFINKYTWDIRSKKIFSILAK
jgi:glycosyltransferase involved in cell wall biosynthesis